MLTLSFTVVLVFCIYGIYRLTTRIPLYRCGWPGVWRLACLIAAVRLSALWFGVTGLRRPDWLQLPAYLVLILDLPEIWLVKSTRTEPYRWAILGSVILATTSFAWAAAFVWVWNRLRVRAETTVARPEDN
jgi:hypothetical protein